MNLLKSDIETNNSELYSDPINDNNQAKLPTKPVEQINLAPKVSTSDDKTMTNKVTDISVSKTPSSLAESTETPKTSPNNTQSLQPTTSSQASTIQTNTPTKPIINTSITYVKSEDSINPQVFFIILAGIITIGVITAVVGTYLINDQAAKAKLNSLNTKTTNSTSTNKTSTSTPRTSFSELTQNAKILTKASTSSSSTSTVSFQNIEISPKDEFLFTTENPTENQGILPYAAKFETASDNSITLTMQAQSWNTQSETYENVTSTSQFFQIINDGTCILAVPTVLDVGYQFCFNVSNGDGKLKVSYTTKSESIMPKPNN